jgi:hypothetical protein
MPELVIKPAKKNGDLPENERELQNLFHQHHKFITLFDALKNTSVMKNYNKQYRKEFGVPSIFDKGQRSEKT